MTISINIEIPSFRECTRTHDIYMSGRKYAYIV